MMITTTTGTDLSIKQADRLYTAIVTNDKVHSLQYVGSGRDFALSGRIVRSRAIIFQIVKLIQATQ